MDLRFIGIDPNTGDGHCPAVFLDHDSGDLVLVAKKVTDPGDHAQILEHTPIGEDERVVRMPARMRDIILKALLGEEHGDDDGADGGPAAVR
ncbi:hypothetical protein AGRA3207_007444 [Actinomadura graeca]|uniref:Uncharacterized protein n=1 Tax=Actinomadura graeca TaxID=2750812 RepID=A0ABX8R638_9ACTN|nr:hypothetical protein [Actinomadura graeca]QXJ25879.1 hypothetical protein AGRA3207_007444 [Actinomadura graeca]